jgi:hypothetical protein
VLRDPEFALRLWRLCHAAGVPDTFWRKVEGWPALQQAACSMAQHPDPLEVHLLVEGLSMSTVLGHCSPTDVWQWVARCDANLDGLDLVCQLWGMLALRAPHHPALSCLGLLLLQYAHNARYAPPDSSKYLLPSSGYGRYSNLTNST